MKRITLIGLCIIISLSMSIPAFAAEQPAEVEAAGAFLQERGIYQGDGSGVYQRDAAAVQRIDYLVVFVRRGVEK